MIPSEKINRLAQTSSGSAYLSSDQVSVRNWNDSDEWQVLQEADVDLTVLGLVGSTVDPDVVLTMLVVVVVLWAEGGDLGVGTGYIVGDALDVDVVLSVLVVVVNGVFDDGWVHSDRSVDDGSVGV